MLFYFRMICSNISDALSITIEDWVIVLISLSILDQEGSKSGQDSRICVLLHIICRITSPTKVLTVNIVNIFL
ncbi:hypothetical protein XENTR_v10005210 [Xenopus tropicalis]|nr:hypothetical protein XENTR_v10005210 [Xenopus tropicalis]